MEGVGRARRACRRHATRRSAPARGARSTRLRIPRCIRRWSWLWRETVGPVQANDNASLSRTGRTRRGGRTCRPTVDHRWLHATTRRGRTPGLPRGRRPVTVEVRGCTRRLALGAVRRRRVRQSSPRGRSAVVVEPSAPSSRAWKPGGALREYARGRSCRVRPRAADARERPQPRSALLRLPLFRAQNLQTAVAPAGCNSCDPFSCRKVGAGANGLEHRLHTPSGDVR